MKEVQLFKHKNNKIPIKKHYEGITVNFNENFRVTRKHLDM